MPLSDDQKAILRLLAQRGAQGYEDLAALLGISVDEVHAKAKDAAAALEAEGIPAPPIPGPGGAGDSPSVANFGEAPPGESPAPKASEPVPPAEGAPVEEAKPEEPKPIPPRPKVHSVKEAAHEVKLLENRGLWAILAGVAIVVLFVVILFVTGGDDGSDSSTTASTTSCKLETAPKPNGKAITALAAAAVKGGKEATRAVL
ncbi:MAG TPA: AsnC family protein, partial [Solirubrobacterales bacterium]|nr:AsnC family protein [Solirubrobacterales bacterium]